MQATGFLELERRLLRRGQAGAAADHEQVVGIDQALGERAPVALPGLGQGRRQGVERGDQGRVIAPVGAQLQDRGQRGQVTLGRGHAALGTGTERDHRIGQLRQRRILDVDQRHHARAGGLGRLGVAQQVRALAGLRDHQVQRALQLLPGLVDRPHRRRGRGGHQPQPGLEQVLGVGRGMIGTAARAGDHERRRVLAQVRGQRAHALVVAGELGGDHRGAGRGLVEHQGFGLAGQHGSTRKDRGKGKAAATAAGAAARWSRAPPAAARSPGSAAAPGCPRRRRCAAG